MRDIAIKSICDKLSRKHQINLEDKVALDFFARGGGWQTQYYAHKVKKVCAWEVDGRFEEDLRNNLPTHSEITIGNSFILAASKKNVFDMVVLDNPQGCYGENEEYCEHFEALHLTPNLLKKEGGLVIFNVKAKPWNYKSNELWQNRRNSFYNLDDCSNLEQEFVFNFYQDFFKKKGYETTFAFWYKRPQEDGLYAMTIHIGKVTNEHH